MLYIRVENSSKYRFNKRFVKWQTETFHHSAAHLARKWHFQNSAAFEHLHMTLAPCALILSPYVTHIVSVTLVFLLQPSKYISDCPLIHTLLSVTLSISNCWSPFLWRTSNTTSLVVSKCQSHSLSRLFTFWKSSSVIGCFERLSLCWEVVAIQFHQTFLFKLKRVLWFVG